MATNNSINISSQGTVYYNGTNAFSGIDASTSGFVLTSNGTGSAPSFQAIPGLNVQNGTRSSGSATSLSTATAANIVIVGLTGAGTWLTFGLVEFGGAPTVSGVQQVSISTTSATHGTTGSAGATANWTTAQFTAGNNFISIPGFLVTVGSAVNIYLVASGTFSGGTMTAYGRLTAVQIA